MASIKKAFSLCFFSILVFTGCSSKKTNSQQYKFDKNYNNLEEFFDGESYERTLKYIEIYSVFSSPGDKFIQEIHRSVFAALHPNSPDVEDEVKNEFWKDIPTEILKGKILGSIIGEQKLYDKKFAMDFSPHLAAKRCSKLYKGESGVVSKIQICLLVSNSKISNIEEIGIQTEIFSLTNKLALSFADPFGSFIVESELKSLLPSPAPEEEVEAKEISDSIAYIRIKSLESPYLAISLGEIFNNFQNSGKNKIILDLRGNNGGIRDVTAEVASLFLPNGAPFLLYRERNNRGEWKEASCDTIKNMPLTFTQFRGPMVVLTDHSTASAGEVLVAALQANKRALIIGQKTFGKGVGFFVGRLSDLGYKSRGVMTLSTFVLYHPFTELCWHLNPIEPDILLEEDIISKITAEEWENNKNKQPYRMSDFKNPANRELVEDLQISIGGLKKCLKSGESLPSINEWDSFIKNHDLQKRLLEEGREGGFAEDLPLYLGIKSLEYFDTI